LKIADKSKNNWVSAVIIDDDDIESSSEGIVSPTLTNNETEVETIVKVEKKIRKKAEKKEPNEKKETRGFH
jgi:hypothetical protein